MKAVILAAGMSLRLRPVTSSKPKCLLGVFGKTILEYQIALLKKVGISDIIIVVGYKKELIIDKLKEISGIEFIENIDFASTNSSYSLYLAKERLINNEFIYLNSDLIFNESALRSLIKCKAEFACVLDRSRNNKDEDSFKAIVESSHVLSMSKKLNTKVEVPGPFRLNKQASIEFFSILDEVVVDDKNMWVYSIFNKLLEIIPLKGVFTNDLWFEVDTVEDYDMVKYLRKL